MERFAIKIDERVKSNLYKICRLCGIDNREQVLILEDLVSGIINDDEPSLSKKILDCVGIKVQVADNMPQKICSLCVDKINDFYEYREMCKATNIQTRDLLGLPQEIDNAITCDSEPYISSDHMKRKRKVKGESIQPKIEDEKPIISDITTPITINRKSKKLKTKKVKFNPVTVNINSTRSSAKKNVSSYDPDYKVNCDETIVANIPVLRRKGIPLYNDSFQQISEIRDNRRKTITSDPLPPLKKRIVVSVLPENNKKKLNSDIAETSNLPIKKKINAENNINKRKISLADEAIIAEGQQMLKRKLSLDKTHDISNQTKKRVTFPDNLPTQRNSKKLSNDDVKEENLIKEDIEYENDQTNFDVSSGSDLLALKTPNKRERQREQDSKKKRKETVSLIPTLELPLKKPKIEPTIPCIVCPKEFKHQHEYDNHFFREHTPNTLDHGCSACREAFYDLQEFKDHQLWHRLSSAPFYCYKCQTSFERLTAYTRHFTSSCIEPPIYTIVDDIKCEQCNKIFLTNNLYDWHDCFIKNNARCRKCGKFFIKKNLMFKHIINCKGKLLEIQNQNVKDISDTTQSTCSSEIITNDLDLTKEITQTKSIVPHVQNPKNNKKGKKKKKISNIPKIIPISENTTASISTDGDKIVKIEPGSILEIEKESHLYDTETEHQITSNEYEDIGFQDDDNDSDMDNNPIHEKSSNSINTQQQSENIEINIENIKQEIVEKDLEKNDEISNPSGSSMIRIKQEPLHEGYGDHIENNLNNICDENILQNIKSEPNDEISNNKTVPVSKPTLKIKIKKEHGTLNSSFIDTNEGENDDNSSSMGSNETTSSSNDVNPHRRHKKRSKSKKIYKIPKQLALLIQQEKENCKSKDTTDSGSDTNITVPIIMNVSSISTEIHTDSNQSQQQQEFLDENITNNSNESNIRVPVITDVVSLEQPRLPLISSVTSLSQTETSSTTFPAIRVKSEFNTFSPSNENLNDENIEPMVRIKSEPIDNEYNDNNNEFYENSLNYTQMERNKINYPTTSSNTVTEIPNIYIKQEPIDESEYVHSNQNSSQINDENIENEETENNLNENLILSDECHNPIDKISEQQTYLNNTEIENINKSLLDEDKESQQQSIHSTTEVNLVGIEKNQDSILTKELTQEQNNEESNLSEEVINDPVESVSENLLEHSKDITNSQVSETQIESDISNIDKENSEKIQLQQSDDLCDIVESNKEESVEIHHEEEEKQKEEIIPELNLVESEEQQNEDTILSNELTKSDEIQSNPQNDEESNIIESNITESEENKSIEKESLEEKNQNEDSNLSEELVNTSIPDKIELNEDSTLSEPLTNISDSLKEKSDEIQSLKYNDLIQTESGDSNDIKNESSSQEIPLNYSKVTTESVVAQQLEYNFNEKINNEIRESLTTTTTTTTLENESPEDLNKIEIDHSIKSKNNEIEELDHTSQIQQLPNDNSSQLTDQIDPQPTTDQIDSELKN